MEFIKSASRKTLFSESIYVLLNVGLAITLLLMVLYIQSLVLPMVLVVVSKWRIFAVRPRYWTANILSNLVDMIVGFSFVIILSAAQPVLWLQIAMTVGFVAWLLIIKPQSKSNFITAQALIAVFTGITALSILTHSVDVILFVLGLWLIGFSSARHILSNYDEPYIKLYSLIWGLVMAELGWLGYHWLFAYSLPGLGGFMLVQLAVIATLISFVVDRCYASYQEWQSVKVKDVSVPIIFGISLILVLLIFFNQIKAGQTI